MARFVALFVVFAAIASAQAPAEPSRGQRVVVSLGTLAGGVAAPAVLYAVPARSWGSPAGVALLVGASVTGMAAGTVAGAEIVGLRSPSATEAFSDAALGLALGGATAAVVGVAVGGTLYYAAGQQSYDIVSPAIGALVGLTAGATVALRLAVRSVEVSPAVLAAPSGERGVGASLRVGL